MTDGLGPDWSLRGAFVRLGLTAAGAGPVTLTATLDGAVVLTATDPGAGALGRAGAGGLWTYTAGIRFDDFELRTSQ